MNDFSDTRISNRNGQIDIMLEFRIILFINMFVQVTINLL